MYDSARCMMMRAGTSKGAYFLEEELPVDIQKRDQFLLRVMGSPDRRQIDGIGGADPLTSKVAVVRKSKRKNVDVDYLFLQVMIDQAIVSDGQNCGNILAGVGPFAIERNLIEAKSDVTDVAIYMQNTGQIAIERIVTPSGQVSYVGEARIDGVPNTASAISITFQDTAGSSCGALLPTGNQCDTIDDVSVTCIDNGMPVVIMTAESMGIIGTETREELEGNTLLKARLESIRLQAGFMMNLGNVTDKTVPKMSMVSKAINGGSISTRTFIPHRCHASIGVLGAVSVATACILPESVAFKLAYIPEGKVKSMPVEHPIGEMTVILSMTEQGDAESAAILRTARKLFDGEVFAK